MTQCKSVFPNVTDMVLFYFFEIKLILSEAIFDNQTFSFRWSNNDQCKYSSKFLYSTWNVGIIGFGVFVCRQWRLVTRLQELLKYIQEHLRFILGFIQGFSELFSEKNLKLVRLWKWILVYESEILNRVIKLYSFDWYPGTLCETYSIPQ